MDEEFEWNETRTGLGEYKREMFMITFLRNCKLPQKIGILYNQCVKKYDYPMTYKSFQREIDQLAEREIIKIKKKIGGLGGNTTYIQQLTV